jgi:hypothetical protein
LSTVGINKIVSVDDVTTVTSVASTINLETSISSYNTIYTLSKYRTINLLRSVNITSSSRYVQNTTVVGAVDLLRLGIEGKYTQNVLGNRLKSFVDGFKSMDVGYANVSYISIGEYSSILPNVTLEDIDGELNTNYLENSYPWNLTYPSIQEHGAILDQNITASSTTVYIPDTSRFPNSGTLLIGDEIVTYTGKLSDRFIGVARGQAGTTAKLHQAGDYMRSLINDKITSWSWNGSGTLFNFSEAGVFWNDQP